MRTNLLPGLVNAAISNRARQADAVRLFELGLVFVPGADGLQQQHLVRNAKLSSGALGTYMNYVFMMRSIAHFLGSKWRNALEHACASQATTQLHMVRALPGRSSRH